MNKSPVIGNSLLLILGIALIFFPGLTLLNAVRLIGAALLVTGVMVLVSSMRDPVKSQFRLYDTFWAVIMVLLGFVFLKNPRNIVEAFPKVMGAVVFMNGLVNFASVRKGVFGRGLAAVSLIFGFLIFMNPFGTVRTLTRLVGIAMVYNAAIGALIHGWK